MPTYRYISKFLFLTYLPNLHNLANNLRSDWQLNFEKNNLLTGNGNKKPWLKASQHSVHHCSTIRSKGEPVNISRGMETLGTPHGFGAPPMGPGSLPLGPGSLPLGPTRLDQRIQVRNIFFLINLNVRLFIKRCDSKLILFQKMKCQFKEFWLIIAICTYCLQIRIVF